MSSSTNHITPELAQRYRRRTLSAVNLRLVEDHLATCAACRRTVSGEPESAAAGPAGSESTHLTSKQLAHLADDDLAPSEAAPLRAHVQTCAQCAIRLRDLEEFRSYLRGGTSEPVTPWYAMILDCLRHPLVWVPLQSVTVAALVVAFQVQPLKQRLREERRLSAAAAQERDRVREENRELAQKAATGNGQTERVAALEAKNDLLLQQQAQLQASLVRETEARRAAERHSVRPDSLLALQSGSDTYTFRPDGTSAGRIDLAAPVPGDVAAAVRDQRLPEPAILLTLDAPPPVPMPDAGARLTLLSPVRTVVLSPQPELTWKPMAGADRYEVSLTDVTEATAPRPVQAAPLATTSPTVTPTAPLLRGHKYEWEVKAFAAGKPLGFGPQKPDGAARFRVMDQQQADALPDNVRKASGSPLLLGIVYAREGLLEEAQRELERVEKSNPQSPVARRIAESVRALRLPRR